MLLILPLIVLLIYLIRGLPKGLAQETVWPSAAAFCGFLMLWSLLNFSGETTCLNHWPDSIEYEFASERIWEEIETGHLSWDGLVRICRSHQFLYPLAIGVGRLSWVDDQMSLLLIVNLLIMYGAYYATLDLLVYAFPKLKVNVVAFSLVFFLATSIGFWSLFLLKDTLVTLMIVAGFVAYRRRDFVFFAGLLLLMGALRSYVMPLSLAAIGGDALLNRQISLKKCVLIGLIALPAMYFAPRQIWKSAEHYRKNQNEWISHSEGLYVQGSTGGYMGVVLSVRFMTTPIFPVDEIKLSAYSSLFWKLGILLLGARLAWSREFRLLCWRPEMRPAILFCVLLLALYWMFPRFANFRHRLPIEPIIAVLFYVAAYAPYAQRAARKPKILWNKSSARAPTNPAV